MPWKLNDSQKIEVFQRYEAGESSVTLATYFGVQPTSIQSLLRRRGHKLRGPKKHTYNTAFFDTLSPEVCYWIGLLYADGWVHRDGLALGLIDKTHIERFRTALNATHPIEEDNKNTKPFYKLRISDRTLPKRISHLGLKNKKSKRLLWPEFPYMREFIRGYFDGDGHLTKAKNGQWSVGFTSCSKSFLEQLQIWIGLGGSLHARVRKTKKHWCLSYNGNGLVPQVVDRFMQEADEFALLRKTKKLALMKGEQWK